MLHTTPFPLTFTTGSSAKLITVDGVELIDFLGEYSAGIFGHSHPEIRKAIENALARGWNYGGHSGLESQLAEAVCARFPALEKVRFTNSGTESNMMALATSVAYAARLNSNKRKVLLFRKGFHGSTISGKEPSYNKLNLNLPHQFLVATYNDTEGTRKMVESLDSTGGKETLAAILVEPMMGNAGCYRAEPSFLKELRRIADVTGAVLIFDEVMTSRLGAYGYGYQTGVTPDLMTLGKWVGGGMTFGAFGGKEAIMNWFDPREKKLEHPGTYNNNVFSMSAGIAGLRVLSADVINDLDKRGDKMTAQIVQVLGEAGLLEGSTVPERPFTDEEQDDHVFIRQYPKVFAKGCGSFLCLHFSGPDRFLLQQLFWHWMLSKGMYLAERGFVALNIMLTDQDAEKFVEGVKGFVRRYHSLLKWT